MEIVNNIINEIIRQEIEYTERTLAEIITKYDFIVGSIECKAKLMEVLPEGANIICSPYIESPNLIYAIKKFDTMELLKYAPTIIETDKTESDHKCHNCKHYTSGDRDGSCCSYICKHYSGWESEG